MMMEKISSRICRFLDKCDRSSSRDRKGCMKKLKIFGCFSFLVLAGSASGQDVSAALKILDGWHQDAPKSQERKLQFVLWSPSDREPPANYQERLPRIMEHIREFYGREMERLGFGRRTINLPYDDQGKMVIHLSKGEFPTDHYEGGSGQEVRKDCLKTLAAAGIDGERETIVMFCNLANWDEDALRFTHKSPYYAGGNHQRGNAWQLDSPELDTVNLAKKEPMIFDGQYGHISLGKHNSIFIGGVAHELGHALGLPHCRERPEEALLGEALMGSGNRSYGDELRGEGKGSFLTLAHGLRLASHPMFSGSTKGMNFPVNATLNDLAITAEGKSIVVKGRVEGNPPVYAVVAYFDPAGGSDYDARTASAVPGEDGSFSLSCDDLPPGRAGELRIFPLHVNGGTMGGMSFTPFSYAYGVMPDGTPDLSTIETKQALKEVIQALSERDLDAAKKAAAGLEGEAAAIARILLDDPPKVDPASGTPGAELSLSSCQPTTARVGWGGPQLNRLPVPPFLLEAGGELFERGIYAHAPSTYQYALGGKWTSLKGKVAVSSGKPGTVQFEIRGDDQVLWRSETVRDGSVIPFSVKVTDVNELTLNVHPTNDGMSSDWGLWLDPVLER